MNWYDRQYSNLNSALKAGSITQAEYDVAAGNVDTTWGNRLDRRATNQANFQKAAGPLSMVGSVMGQFSNTNGSLDNQSAQAREGMRNAIGQMGPWGAAISAVTGVVDTAADALGGAWQTVDTDAADRAGAKGAAVANNILASIPGNSVFGAFMGKTEESQKSQYIDGMSNSFGGSVQDINAAQEMGGKRVAFGKAKMNAFIKEQNRINNLMTSIGMQSEMAKNNDAGQLYQVQNANKYAGYSPKLLMSKKGSKFPELDSARILLKNLNKNKERDLVINALDKDIQTLSNPDRGEIGKFQLGGKIDKNFIPQGALHKNKHHLEDVNPDLEGSITKKGIPVVSMGEGGVQQHAEVEKNEIVFCLSTTHMVEELYKKYQETEDENILIECGKFLTSELLKNTEDPGKLRKTIE